MALNGIKVLIVENDPVFRQLVGDYCRQQGMFVDEAEDGQVGLEHALQQRPDLMLVDLCMPRMGGQELLSKVAHFNPEIPSIVISANKAMSDVVEALRNGAWDYLMKPIKDLNILHNAMTDCLQESGGLTALSPTPPDPDGSEHALKDNLDMLRKDTDTAQLVQAQLFPPAQVNGANCQFGYSLFKTDAVSDRLCDGFEVEPDHFCAYLVKMNPADPSNAFVSVLLRSFLNQKMKRYRQGGSTAILEPKTILGYLNEQLVKSGLSCAIDIVYMVLDQRNGQLLLSKFGKGVKSYINSGNGLSPILLADSKPLGVKFDNSPINHCRTLEPAQSLVLLEGDVPQLAETDFSGVEQATFGGVKLQLQFQ